MTSEQRIAALEAGLVEACDIALEWCGKAMCDDPTNYPQPRIEELQKMARPLAKRDRHICPRCLKPTMGGSDTRDGSALCWCPDEDS